VTLSEIYLKAAEVIRTNGHYKGAFFTRSETGVGIELAAAECPVCVAGAVSMAVFGWPVPSGYEADERAQFDAAARQLADLIGVAGDPMLEPVGRLAGWNDLPERTPADVIAALEQAAKAVA
jgi:hypothetical protein